MDCTPNGPARAGLTFLLACGAWLGLLVGESHAAQFRVRSETIGDAYQLVRSDQQRLNRRRLHQYLGLDAYDLTGHGDARLNLVTLMRFDADFGLDDEDFEGILGYRNNQLSIQAAYLEGRDLGGVLDFRLGRQFHADPIDYLMLDGLVATVRSPWHVGVEVQVGVEADNRLGSVTSSQLELDGVRQLQEVQTGPGGVETVVNIQRDDKPKIVLGAALVLADLQWTQARVGYRRLISDGKVVQEKVGAAFSQRIARRVDLSLVGSYDLYRHDFDQIRAGVGWRVTDAFDLDLEYVRLVPTFDADSIFNVFNTLPLSDLNGRLRMHLSADEAIYAGAMLRFFNNDQFPEDRLTEPVDRLVTAGGAVAGWSRRFGGRGDLSVDVSYESGYGGTRALLDISGSWQPVVRVLELDGRLTGLRFEDGLQEGLRSWGAGYQLGAAWLLDTRANIRLAVEHNFNRIQTSQLRVMLVADLSFWL
ncbi:MAG: hypothetical protein H6744_18705 [Deltaproteobacteria bacterium]|nr:hypothetical protein [Deltaproteobacteria bacterium]MCB9788713.1 hypothetical protein [Deltaproteobacteria bacterium]